MGKRQKREPCGSVWQMTSSNSSSSLLLLIVAVVVPLSFPASRVVVVVEEEVWVVLDDSSESLQLLEMFLLCGLSLLLMVVVESSSSSSLLLINIWEPPRRRILVWRHADMVAIGSIGDKEKDADVRAHPSTEDIICASCACLWLWCCFVPHGRIILRCRRLVAAAAGCGDGNIWTDDDDASTACELAATNRHSTNMLLQVAVLRGIMMNK